MINIQSVKTHYLLYIHTIYNSNIEFRNEIRAGKIQHCATSFLLSCLLFKGQILTPNT